MRDTITLAAALDNGLKEILETDPGEPGPWQGGWASKARQTKVPVPQPLNSGHVVPGSGKESVCNDCLTNGGRKRGQREARLARVLRMPWVLIIPGELQKETPDHRLVTADESLNSPRVLEQPLQDW